MNFFNIDCHVSVIADIKNIFETLGHKVDNWSLSGHNFLFGYDECKSNVVNKTNWMQLDEQMADSFYEEHKEELDKYDAFVCCYPPAFLKLFERFDKPIIVIAATRYDHPFTSDPDRLSWLEDSLNNNDNLILVTNNAFDKAYCEEYLNKEWTHIPSLCDYTGAKWKKKSDKSILFSKCNIKMSGPIIDVKSLGRYSWEDLYSYNQIIHFPYNVSTMSIFEQYQAGVPLVFPSLDYALELMNGGVDLFSEIVFPNNHRQPLDYKTREWLELSDFYDGTIKCSYINVDGTITKGEAPTSNREMIFDKWEKILKKL